MAMLKAAWNPTTRTVTVLPNATAAPGGTTNLGSFNHDEDNDVDPLETNENHVIWHHVRDLLYKIGVQDMHTVTLLIPVAVTGLSIQPATLSLKVNETHQLQAFPLPDTSTDRRVTYVSATPATATVDANGLVTAKAVGTVTITATTVDGAKTDTCVVTVTA